MAACGKIVFYYDAKAPVIIDNGRSLILHKYLARARDPEPELRAALLNQYYYTRLKNRHPLLVVRQSTYQKSASLRLRTKGV